MIHLAILAMCCSFVQDEPIRKELGEDWIPGTVKMLWKVDCKDEDGHPWRLYVCRVSDTVPRGPDIYLQIHVEPAWSYAESHRKTPDAVKLDRIRQLSFKDEVVFKNSESNAWIIIKDDGALVGYIPKDIEYPKEYIRITGTTPEHGRRHYKE